MKSIFKAVVIILCLLINTHSLIGNNANNNIDHILIINAYTDANPWSNSLINPIVSMAAQNSKVGAITAHLKMLTLKDSSGLEKLKEDIIRKFSTQTPKMIVFIGCSSFILCDEINRQWPDIPMILCGERDYTGREEIVVGGQALPFEQRIPISSLHEKYNLTFMLAHNYMEENLHLMKQLLPQMNKIIYIGDETYICQQNNYDLSEVVQRNHPELKYEFISAQTTSTDSLFEILNKQNQQTTGVLFTSWIRKKDYTDNLVMTTNSHRIIATASVPLFSLRTVGIKEEGGIVGGYVYNEKKYINQMLSTIHDILNGKQPRNIPFYELDNGSPVFNYQSLLQRKLDPDHCPKNTIFFNAPPTFWEQYEYFIIGSICLLILILLFFQYHRVKVLEKMKHIQQNELKTVGRYHNLINNMPILYMLEELIKDKDGRIVEVRFADVNKRFEEKFLKRSEVIGKTDTELFPDSTMQFHHFMNIAINEKRSITFSHYNKTVDAFYDVLVNLNGDERYMDVFCMDSTELHHTQEQLRSINHKLSMALDVANIMPWKWDLQNHTIYYDVNTRIELNDHNEADDEPLSVPEDFYFANIHQEDLAKVKEAYADLLEGRTKKIKEEYRVINKVNGAQNIDWVEVQAAVESYDEKGQPLTLIGSSLIITERKNLESELISAKNRAEESNRLKSAFLANMSHEIRTPLNAIVGFSGILASTEEEEEKMEYVSIIENNNALLLQLISDILDLSKIEAGTMEFIETDFELNKVMWELESSLHLKLPADKAIELIFEAGLPEFHIHAERNRISQIIINLVTNAIKFTECGSIKFGYEKRDDVIFFYVTDTGCGIPEDKLESVFGRFVKLNSFAQGTGLGLSICQTLVQHMGGEIGVNSKTGEGSTFWFTVPYVAVTNFKQEKTVPKPIKLEQQKITILVAEDHNSNYRLIESILKKDYDLIHAWNGEEAVAMFRKYNPQIILMDINMPVMDGYEATKEIRKISVQVPIIAITAFAYASDEQRVMDNGFDAYMAKPINANQLRGQINSMLKKHIIFM